MSDDLFYFNGVNASTGTYLTPPLSAQELVPLARGEKASTDPNHLADLRLRQEQNKAHLGVKVGVDPKDLAQTGWGVIFAQGASPALRDALATLLNFRKQQANRLKERYREYVYVPSETKNEFLVRNGVGIGAVDPDRMPYYLLIVGDPEQIPYSFQYQLDVAYAVGRLDMDSPEQYAYYAQSVVRAEQGQVTRGKRASFFGVANANDVATQATSNQLVKPLAEKLGAAKTEWTFDTLLGEAATKTRLEGLLNDRAPALLFTASHGAAFDLGDSRQLKHQGALVCQEWVPADMQGKPLSQDTYYAMDDVTADAQLHGMITFHFACFGAGTPRDDEYAEAKAGISQARQIAPASFVAKLPKTLLAHPKGGVLASVGHIDRAWGASFLWNTNIEQLGAFENTLQQLLEGYPVGAAMEFFNARYAELATSLSGDLAAIKVGKRVDPKVLVTEWSATNDARGYAVIGDPAVRLNVNGGASGALPAVESLTMSVEDSRPSRSPETSKVLDSPEPGSLSAESALSVTSDAQSPATIEERLNQMEQQIAALAQTLQELRAALGKN